MGMGKQRLIYYQHQLFHPLPLAILPLKCILVLILQTKGNIKINRGAEYILVEPFSSYDTTKYLVVFKQFICLSSIV